MAEADLLRWANGTCVGQPSELASLGLFTF